MSPFHCLRIDTFLFCTIEILPPACLDTYNLKRPGLLCQWIRA